MWCEREGGPDSIIPWKILPRQLWRNARKAAIEHYGGGGGTQKFILLPSSFFPLPLSQLLVREIGHFAFLSVHHLSCFFRGQGPCTYHKWGSCTSLSVMAWSACCLALWESDGGDPEYTGLGSKWLWGNMLWRSAQKMQAGGGGPGKPCLLLEMIFNSFCYPESTPLLSAVATGLAHVRPWIPYRCYYQQNQKY